ncbi:hypothetical protein PACTADRAFT_64188 [Pachysolen tannophilus NRRL Y-2460]|uniref:Uncharacterized protein n=1 Tax=Pachysolen tannophilus NRRL Y-2460 TaxID=669874 RepID=A0A1E4U2R7_PACTA|nr:hypothetical protein PACTADRAFT_64188 [Pachysolen tannophilus NRRL Y-2460]
MASYSENSSGSSIAPIDERDSRLLSYSPAPNSNNTTAQNADQVPSSSQLLGLRRTSTASFIDFGSITAGTIRYFTPSGKISEEECSQNGNFKHDLSNDDRRFSSISTVEEMQSKYLTLKSARPMRLIGKIGRLQNWSLVYKDKSELQKIKNKKVKFFYEKQNQLLQRFREIDRLLDSGIQMSMLKYYGSDIIEEDGMRDQYHNEQPHLLQQQQAQQAQQAQYFSPRYSPAAGVPGNIDEETGLLLGYNAEQESSAIQVAIIVNFIINVFLLLSKIVAVILTSSISIVASLTDSILDFLSTTIIFISNKLATHTNNKFAYPVGRSRLEPLGVLIFSVIIIVSFMQVGTEAFRILIAPEHELVKIGLTPSLIMLLTIAVKLICFFWCKSINSSSVQALAEDARTDIVFNTSSIVFPLIGHYFEIWWVDPLCALSLCVYIVLLWCSIAYEHSNNLTGAAASKEDYQTILYLCSRFAESIKKITKLQVYHVGDNVNVEVDLILDSSLSFRDCHDIAESLQYTIEMLPIVERCFVHIDYRVGNYIGHITK